MRTPIESKGGLARTHLMMGLMMNPRLTKCFWKPGNRRRTGRLPLFLSRRKGNFPSVSYLRPLPSGVPVAFGERILAVDAFGIREAVSKDCLPLNPENISVLDNNVGTEPFVGISVTGTVQLQNAGFLFVSAEWFHRPAANQAASVRDAAFHDCCEYLDVTVHMVNPSRAFALIPASQFQVYLCRAYSWATNLAGFQLYNVKLPMLVPTKLCQNPRTLTRSKMLILAADQPPLQKANDY
jgi:hypothetical protein